MIDVEEEKNIVLEEKTSGSSVIIHAKHVWFCLYFAMCLFFDRCVETQTQRNNQARNLSWKYRNIDFSILKLL